MKKIVVFLFCLVLISGAAVLFFVFKDKIFVDNTDIILKLKGDSLLTYEFGDSYEEPGYNASYKKEDITDMVKVSDDIDQTKLGEYTITYKINYKKKSSTKKRKVTFVDTTKPELVLEGKDTLTYYVGQKYNEPGYSASDNYDGDLTKEVVISDNINGSQEGEYSVEYIVSDSSGNSVSAKRVVIFKEKPLPDINATAGAIPVLNYHFFCDPTRGESCSGSNFITVQSFEEQLKFLRDNNYKTLTIGEFNSWMYGQMELPARSVLLTIDDGAAGTGRHNGNKLIPLLEKYQMHATLFLITGWWDINNYKSPYLDIQSHSNDMHTENFCEGVSRGAKMLCLNNEEVLSDLRTSISVIGDSTAYCFPFYASSDNAINLLKEAGFKLAFVGGDVKATRGNNKYKIPRYHIYKSITIEQFKNMVS